MILNNILKKLYKTNFFQDVEVKIENSILIISCKRKSYYTKFNY